MALASGGCFPQPKETIVPYVRAPEHFVPGRPSYFATSITLAGYAIGVLVESHLGRPTKIEGNPAHPSSLGAVDAFSQAAVLGLYDPDRSQAVSNRGEVQTWQAFSTAVTNALSEQQQSRGAGLRILTPTFTSPTLVWQLNQLLAQYPEARWIEYEPINQDNALQGAILAFGRPLEAHYQFDRAAVVLSLDSDFLAFGPGSLAHSRAFMAGRDPLQYEQREGTPNRLFVVEPMPTCTGTVADHRLALSPSQVELAVPYLARQLLDQQLPGGNGLPPAAVEWLNVVAQQLRGAGGQAAIVAGPALSPTAHALVHGMNFALGNSESVIRYRAPVVASQQGQVAALGELVEEMDAGRVDVLVMMGGNPVFNAPADFDFGAKLKKVRLPVHLSLYDDETSAACEWHVPAAHELESWSDARAFDGTASIIQPLIAPLYEGKTIHEVAALLLGNAEANGYEIVREFWRTQWGDDGFELRWHTALHDGLIRAGDSEAATAVEPDEAAEFTADLQQLASDSTAPRTRGAIEISLRPDPTIYDGRFANNGWLQELPKPITKLTWDNAALMSRAMANRLQVGTEDVIRIETPAGRISLPAWIVPGHADDCITVHLGYGRERAGNVAAGAGANAYRIRTSQDLWNIRDATVAKTEERRVLACTQLHHEMEHADPAHWLTRAAYQAGPALESAQHDAYHEPADPDEGHAPHEHPNLYDPDARPTDDADYAWGMTINLNTCIGCGACVVACQAENNIPVVGKDMVLRNREMHWLRIDTYIDEREDTNITIHQPLACVHCEHAPCELVCPVGATVHSAEGLNEMVYNRCVGTRYCSHNCPYKVRRFNFFNYTDDYPPTLQLLQNPDVTVRMRGVMEKCTYCVQRISAARIAAKKDDRKIQDGEVITACQGACPTRAIQFGNILDQQSVVAQQRQHPLGYRLLDELNTRPRTTYITRIMNPADELQAGTVIPS